MNDQAHDAGLLLKWALDRKKSAASSDEYARLLTLYYSNDEFRQVVDDTANGLGLRVIPMRTGDAQDRQLILGTDPESPFAKGKSVLRTAHPSSTAENRMLTGVIHAGIAATIYPTEADLDRPLEQRRIGIQPADVHETITSIIANITQNTTEDDEGDSDANAPFRLYSQQEEASSTITGRYKRDSAIGRIEYILNTYVDEGLMTFEGERYRPTFYYQAHLQEYAATRAFQILNEYRQGDDGAA